MSQSFQSTLPTRGSDAEPSPPGRRRHFNPRSPRGGATVCRAALRRIKHISIHAPHEGERPKSSIVAVWPQEFQSTLPTRGSDPFPLYRAAAIRTISIHAPHEGERQRKSAFVYSISANLLNIIHCGTVTRAVSRRRIALFRLFSVRRSGVFMYAYASH